jgi:hypothetical protein
VVRIPTIAQIDSKENSHSFVINAQLHMNGIGLPIKALCDTGASARLLISPQAAEKAVKRLGASKKKLKTPIVLSDYRRQEAGRITHVLYASLEINQRRFLKQRFWITECGHDVFIGHRWLVERDVYLHPRTKTLMWPEDQPPLAKYSPAVILPKEDRPPIDLEAQRDANRRDRAMEKEIKRIKILQRPWRQLVVEDQEASKAQPSTGPVTVDVAALQARVAEDPRQVRWRSRKMPQKPVPFEIPDSFVPTVDIAALSQEHLWKTNKGESIPFSADEDPDHVRLVREKLPTQLKHLEGFFSKKASTKLPPHREKHDVVLELKTPRKGSPPTYRTPLQYMPLEKQTIDELLKLGFIERCMEPEAAPVLFVPKTHSDERRFCVDYRWINQFLKDRIVQAPNVNGTIASCRNAKRFTKIDIIRAFNRLRIAVGSEYLTAFRTRQGTFQWRVLPFGLKVGPAWWQDFINAQLNELLDLFASAYADDVLIYSDDDDEEAHWEQVEEVIHRLSRVDLQGDIKKSRFNVTLVDYLGIVMEAGVGVRIDPEKVKAIRNWKFSDLNSKTAIRSFLGLCNYVRMFCYHASDAAEPLNRLLKKDAPWQMGPDQEQAFETLKALACEAPVVAFFVPGRPTKVEADASRNATGGVIWQQQPDGEWKPVGYFSKTMTPTERAYPIQDRELLAVVQTLQQYEPELLGTKFCVLTDHQALVYFSTKRTLSTRQVRWADFLSNFDITFTYRRGKDNIAADALSRKTVDLPTVKAREQEERNIALIPPEKVQLAIAAVQEDASTPNISGADLVDLIRTENEKQQLGQHDGKLVVPELTSDGKTFLRTALIREAHEPKIFGHQGQNKTIEALRKQYYWGEINKDVRRYVKNCHACGRNKGRHDRTPGLLHPLPVPNLVWEQVVVDGKDMPPDRHGYNYVWVFICKFSRLMMTLAGNKSDTGEVLASRYYRFGYRFLGCPYSWLTDNAGPFISAFMGTLNKLTGIKHRHGSSMHPQTQGSVEITNQELDQKLRFYVDKYQTDWSDHLPAFDFGHNASWHSSINMAPLKVVLGTDPRNPLSTDLPAIDVQTDQEKRALQIVQQTKEVQDLARQEALRTQRRQTEQANKKRRPVDFKVGDYVFLRKKGFITTAPTTRLDSQYAGPWRITDERGYSFVLDLPKSFRGKNLFHADRLRKAHMNPLPQQHRDPPQAEEINGEAEWEVERVLASRLTGRNKILEYQVSWQGCDPDDVWYPAENFKNASVVIETFHRDYPDAAGPPVRLRDWIRAAADDRTDEPHPDDNVAEHGELNAQRRQRRHK